MRVAIVGPCGSGKSTLAKALTARGHEAWECVQEHSFAPGMWRRVHRPDVLIYLDVSLHALRQRKPGHDWTRDILEEQQNRLRDARECCDLYVDTSARPPMGVLEDVLAFLEAFA